jgi:hypothetical protein
MDFRPADHAMGLELQIEELIEQRRRALVQDRSEDVGRFDREIEALQAELAATAEILAVLGPQPEEPPYLHDAEQLRASSEPS